MRCCGRGGTGRLVGGGVAVPPHLVGEASQLATDDLALRRRKTPLQMDHPVVAVPEAEATSPVLPQRIGVGIVARPVALRPQADPATELVDVLTARPVDKSGLVGDERGGQVAVQLGQRRHVSEVDLAALQCGGRLGQQAEASRHLDPAAGFGRTQAARLAQRCSDVHRPVPTSVPPPVELGQQGCLPGVECTALPAQRSELGHDVGIAQAADLGAGGRVDRIETCCMAAAPLTADLARALSCQHCDSARADCHAVAFTLVEHVFDVRGDVDSDKRKMHEID
jgi:hypothetical protein